MFAFDYDGTLIRTWTSEPIPGVQERLAELRGPLIVCTNQAGPIWRAMTRDETYPTAGDVARQIANGLAALLPEWTRMRPGLLLVSVAEPRLSDRDGYDELLRQIVIHISGILDVQLPRWTHEVSAKAGWRKPHPGMLLRAAEWYGVKPWEMIYVGDRPSDESAALAAGMSFMWARNFFGWEG